jgi:hypothetical protein
MAPIIRVRTPVRFADSACISSPTATGEKRSGRPENRTTDSRISTPDINRIRRKGCVSEPAHSHIRIGISSIAKGGGLSLGTPTQQVDVIGGGSSPSSTFTAHHHPQLKRAFGTDWLASRLMVGGRPKDAVASNEERRMRRLTWFAPFPPGVLSNPGASTVCPGVGSDGGRHTRSTISDPSTVTVGSSFLLTEHAAMIAGVGGWDHNIPEALAYSSPARLRRRWREQCLCGVHTHCSRVSRIPSKEAPSSGLISRMGRLAPTPHGPCTGTDKSSIACQQLYKPSKRGKPEESIPMCLGVPCRPHEPTLALSP